MFMFAVPSFPGRFPLWSNKHLSSISSVIDRLRALRQGPVAMSLRTNGEVRCTLTSLSHLLQWLRCCATDQVHLVSKMGQLDRTSQFRRASLFGLWDQARFMKAPPPHRGAVNMREEDDFICGSGLLLLVPAGQDPGIG
jgi:hypothetical protein